MVFDAGRQFRQVLGRRRAAATNGPSASTASTSTTRASSGSAATIARRRGMPGLKPVADDALAEVHARRQVRPADRQQQPEQGRRRHGQRASRRGRVGACRAPTSCSSPTATAITASSCSTPTPARSSGPGAPSASRPAATDSCAIVGAEEFPRWRGPAALQRRARHPRRQRRHGVSRRPREPARADVHERRQVREAIGPHRRRRSRAISPSRRIREQQFLYVGGGKAIVVVDRKTLESSGEIQIPGQIGAGPPHRDRFQRQYLHRADHRRHAEARVQGHSRRRRRR